MPYGTTPVKGFSFGNSWTDICNGALRHVGARRIQTLQDGTESAIACADMLADAITEVIAADDDWCVLRKRAQLSVAPEYVPPNDFLYAYALPNDIVNFSQDGVEAIDAPAPTNPSTIPPGSPSSHEWRIESSYLLTNATLVYLTYTRQLMDEDAATLPRWFTLAIEHKLAEHLAMPLRQNATLATRLEKKADQAIRAAISMDDQMKETWEGSKTRGYEYYEQRRYTGYISSQGSAMDPDWPY